MTIISTEYTADMAEADIIAAVVGAQVRVISIEINSDGAEPVALYWNTNTAATRLQNIKLTIAGQQYIKYFPAQSGLSPKGAALKIDGNQGPSNINVTVMYEQGHVA